MRWDKNILSPRWGNEDNHTPERTMIRAFQKTDLRRVASVALLFLLATADAFRTTHLPAPRASPTTAKTTTKTKTKTKTTTTTTTTTAMRSSTGTGGAGDEPPVTHVVVAGAGVIGVSTAYYLAKNFGVATTLVDPTGTIAPAASGKAGGFLALDWNDNSPALGPLARRSFALHEELADDLGADTISYRRLECVSVPVGENGGRRPAGRKLEGIEWAEGANAMGDASVLGGTRTIAQVHPKKLCDAMWERVLELAPESKLVRGRVVAPEDKDGDAGADAAVAARLEDGSLLEGDALLYSCGPWTATNMYGTKYHSLVVPTTRVLHQCVFFSGLGDPEVYVRGDSTAYCTGFPDPPVRVAEHPGEEEVRPEAIDRIRESVRAASSFADGASTSYLVLGDDGDDGRQAPLEQACYLPGTADGIPMMGRVPGKERTYVCAGHTCWGILLGPASGEAMAHEIAAAGGRGSSQPFVDLGMFSPGRFGRPLELVPAFGPER
ncbi:unnamed protein product [Pseudo-nitzschia multistriata]|uniref:FAD dependent oxidoreductase domain-containing protein n=1 Tax=Pseudo-nitzschia multistriata TaxID=183589 RepID=A0A448Z1T6_9STRA|nr:unnamed protein product [Pseudo-nitzschia multistriata]